MIKIQGKIPREVYLACSGGVDSMAVLDFLSRSHRVTVLHYNHATEHGKEAEEFLTSYCANARIPIITKKNSNTKPASKSWEEWWRECRYEFLDEFDVAPVLTCHHLDDCVETWIWSSLNGRGKIIPYRRGNVVRPFRLTRKHDFTSWASRNSVPYKEDPSNSSVEHCRNYIRHTLMPHVLHVNPGIHKTVKRKVEKSGTC
jgi:tRNA(Ile)-lysidine synthase